MEKKEIIELLTRFPAMQLATVNEKGEPHTRGMFMYSADETGIIFHTGSFKTLYGELKNNPQVETSFLNTEKFIQVRVRGKAEEIDDRDFRIKIINTPGREFLKPVVEKHGVDAVRVFKIKNCKAIVWSMQTNMEYPKSEIIF